MSLCVCVCVCAPCGRGRAVTGKCQAQKLLNGCNKETDGSNMKSGPEYIETYQRTKGSLEEKEKKIEFFHVQKVSVPRGSQNDRMFI